MRIAILGATSEIAKDLIYSFSMKGNHQLVLFARRPLTVQEWLIQMNFSRDYSAQEFESFSVDENFDVLINFVGVGNPARNALMGATIFDVTRRYDEMALAYLEEHPNCQYIFLSSGAAFGTNFTTPVDDETKALININHLQPGDWYGISKLYAESRHRSLSHLSIVDVRVFNYFSHTQNIDARYLISDIVRAIRDKTVLKTSADVITRDYIGPADFYQLICNILSTKDKNEVLDCFSKAPIDKHSLLMAMNKKFGLQYEFTQGGPNIDFHRIKINYYSLNKKASLYGYHPTLSSLDLLLSEVEILLKNLNSELQ